MVLENISEGLVYAIPPELVSKAGFLINILQALGFFLIFYIVFSVINTIINRRRNRQIESVISHIETMNNNISEMKNILRNRR